MRPCANIAVSVTVALLLAESGFISHSHANDFKNWEDAVEPPEVRGLGPNDTPKRLRVIEAKIDSLISQDGDVNSRDSNGNTPLMFSIIVTGDAVPILVAKGADVNAANGVGMTPLLFALRSAQYGNVDRTKQSLQIARFLIKRGANPNSTNKAGETPLMLAADNCDGELVTLLLEQGANKNLRDAKKRTAENRAKAISCSSVVAALKVSNR